jgi:hypothetical protein
MHPAVVAWQTLSGSHRTPDAVETLRRTSKAAFRLHGVDDKGRTLIAKRRERDAALREYTIYRNLLAPLSGAVACHGSLETADGVWLFLDDAAGERYDPADTGHRRLAGEWLAALHEGASKPPDSMGLRSVNTDDYLMRLQAARDALQRYARDPIMNSEAALLQAMLDALGTVESRWTEVISLCGALPATLVHGDLAKHNVRVRVVGDGEALTVFDWEDAGWGTPAVDLAQSSSRPGAIAVDADLISYCDAAGCTQSRAARERIALLASVGALFRCMFAIGYEAPWFTMAFEDGERASHALAHIRRNFSVYQAELNAAVQRAGLD